MTRTFKTSSRVVVLLAAVAAFSAPFTSFTVQAMDVTRGGDVHGSDVVDHREVTCPLTGISEKLNLELNLERYGKILEALGDLRQVYLRQELEKSGRSEHVAGSTQEGARGITARDHFLSAALRPATRRSEDEERIMALPDVIALHDKERQDFPEDDLQPRNRESTTIIPLHDKEREVFPEDDLLHSGKNLLLHKPSDSSGLNLENFNADDDEFLDREWKKPKLSGRRVSEHVESGSNSPWSRASAEPPPSRLRESPEDDFFGVNDPAQVVQKEERDILSKHREIFRSQALPHHSLDACLQKQYAFFQKRKGMALASGRQHDEGPTSDPLLRDKERQVQVFPEDDLQPRNRESTLLLLPPNNLPFLKFESGSSSRRSRAEIIENLCFPEKSKRDDHGDHDQLPMFFLSSGRPGRGAPSEKNGGGDDCMMQPSADSTNENKNYSVKYYHHGPRQARPPYHDHGPLLSSSYCHDWDHSYHVFCDNFFRDHDRSSLFYSNDRLSLLQKKVKEESVTKLFDHHVNIFRGKNTGANLDFSERRVGEHGHRDCRSLPFSTMVLEAMNPFINHARGHENAPLRIAARKDEDVEGVVRALLAKNYRPWVAGDRMMMNPAEVDPMMTNARDDHAGAETESSLRGVERQKDEGSHHGEKLDILKTDSPDRMMLPRGENENSLGLVPPQPDDVDMQIASEKEPLRSFVAMVDVLGVDEISVNSSPFLFFSNFYGHGTCKITAIKSLDAIKWKLGKEAPHALLKSGEMGIVTCEPVQPFLNRVDDPVSFSELGVEFFRTRTKGLEDSKLVMSGRIIVDMNTKKNRERYLLERQEEERARAPLLSLFERMKDGRLHDDKLLERTSIQQRTDFSTCGGTTNEENQHLEGRYYQDHDDDVVFDDPWNAGGQAKKAGDAELLTTPDSSMPEEKRPSATNGESQQSQLPGNDEESQEKPDTQLMMKASAGDLEGVRRLLAEPEVRKNVNARSAKKQTVGKTALAFAATMGHTQIVELLLAEMGNEINVNLGSVNIDKRTREPDWNSLGRTPLHSAAVRGYAGVVELLVERDDIDVNALAGSPRHTPLHAGAEAGHAKVVKALLKHRRIDVNALLQKEGDQLDGATPLLLAAREGHANVVRVLLEYNSEDSRRSTSPDNQEIDVNASLSTSGRTALLEAARKGRTEVVELLLERGEGLKVNETGSWSVDRNTSLGTALFAGIMIGYQGSPEKCRTQKFADGLPFLMETELQGREGVMVIRALIADKRVDVNMVGTVNGKKYTPLSLAAEMGDAETIRLLLEGRSNNKDIDVNKPFSHDDMMNHHEDQQQSALFIAASQGHLDIVDRLLKYPGIDPNVGANKGYLPQDYELESFQIGETPLFIAARKGHPDVVGRLLEHQNTNPNMGRVWDVDVFERLLSIMNPEASTNYIKAGRRKRNSHSGRIIEGCMTPLMIAASNGFADVVEVFLKDPRVDANLRMPKEIHGLRPTALLLAVGIDMKDKDKDKEVCKGRAEVVRTMINQRRDQKHVDFNLGIEDKTRIGIQIM